MRGRTAVLNATVTLTPALSLPSRERAQKQSPMVKKSLPDSLSCLKLGPMPYVAALGRIGAAT